jgi:hypothetical protein
VHNFFDLIGTRKVDGGSSKYSKMNTQSRHMWAEENT